MADVTLNTVLRNLVWLGEACYTFHDQNVRGLNCMRIEADEAWAFIYAKDKTLASLPRHLRAFAGTRWTWISIDPDSKMVVNWHVGRHKPSDAQEFMDDLASRIPGRLQLTSDQLQHYRAAVENAFGDRVDYATIQKVMGKPRFTPDGRIEQPKLRKNRKASVYGHPDEELVTTTTIEAQNLLLRMSNRRYTRFTNAFSRRIRNMRASVALHFTYYNFCRIHPVIRVTPAMEAGLVTSALQIEELIERLNVEESRKEPY
ncbi:MAG: hypothetical protein Q7S40_25255 [Opitutaceae bacterium]|nr:hypothetical protein [Opitutaceae bacterium]